MGVRHLALTDHDTTAGLSAAQQAAKRAGIEFLNGIEINTAQEGDTVHILGYGLNPQHPSLLKKLQGFRGKRQERIQLILEKLKRAGISLPRCERGEDHSIGRPHIADLLVQAGHAANRSQAFRRYLLPGGPAYVPPRGPSSAEAIETIREAGGVAVLAHPFLVSKNDTMVPALVEEGLLGLEVYYPSHTARFTQELLQIARRHSLIATGGSDFHGPETGRGELGGCEVPFSVWEQLQDKLSLDDA